MIEVLETLYTFNYLLQQIIISEILGVGYTSLFDFILVYYLNHRARWFFLESNALPLCY